MGWDVNVHVNLRQQLMLRTRGVGGGGVGWDVNVHVNLRQQLMLRTRGVGWGGVGWGGVGAAVDATHTRGGGGGDARVAQSQWHHWIGNKDPWKTQGEVLKAVRDLQLL